jgi:hypothetical protein
MAAINTTIRIIATTKAAPAIARVRSPGSDAPG